MTNPSADKKPREFSLHEDGMWYGAEELPPKHKETMYHVILMSAYRELENKLAQIERVRLKWFENYKAESTKNAALEARIEKQEKSLNILRRYHGGDGSVTRKDVIEALSADDKAKAGEG